MYLVWTALYVPVYIYEACENPKQFNLFHTILLLFRDIIFKGIYRLWYLHALVIGVSIVYLMKCVWNFSNRKILAYTGGGIS